MGTSHHAYSYGETQTIYSEEDVDRVALFLESTSLESSQGNDEDEEEEGNKSSVSLENQKSQKVPSG